jgi:hypothetical protein
MPDLRTALTTALTQSKEKQVRTHTPQDIHKIIDRWNDEKPKQQEQPRHGKITTNTSRATFNAIRDNPHRTAKELCDLLGEQGYSASSVSTLVTQMVRCGMVTRTANGAVYTSLKEYQPIKKVPAPVKYRHKKAHVQSKTSGIVALPRTTQAAPPAPVTPTTSKLNIDALLATITLKEAVELIAALQNMLDTLRRN